MDLYDCFHVLAIINSAAMNIGMHVSFQFMIFSRYMPGVGFLLHTIVLSFCEWDNWQGINLQNIQTSCAAQSEKKNQPNQKMGRACIETFLQRRHADC